MHLTTTIKRPMVYIIQYYVMSLHTLQHLFPVTSVAIPMAMRSQLQVCGRSLAGIAGSCHAGGKDMSLLWVLCIVAGRSLCDGPITNPGSPSE